VKQQKFHRPLRAYRTLPLVLGILLFVLPTPSIAVHIGKILSLLAILAINTRWGEPRVWYAFVLFLVVMVVGFIPALHVWNPLVVPATGFALVAYARPRWLMSDRWLLRGRASRATWVLALLTIPLSAGALVAWAHMTQPDLTMYADMIPGSGIGVLLAAAIVFALFNAIAEEMVFRGVIWQALADTGLTLGGVLVIQALAFGLLHLGGVPSGLPGLGLATIYGLALGAIRLLSKGLPMPVIAHAFADLTIFLIIKRLAERW
jgi:membrane protease YdiL (CAAX protease family)